MERNLEKGKYITYKIDELRAELNKLPRLTIRQPKANSDVEVLSYDDVRGLLFGDIPEKNALT